MTKAKRGWNPFRKKESNTVVYNKGYIAGYNQARVDNGLMTQNEADRIVRKVG